MLAAARLPRRPLIGVAGAVAATALVLTGCSAGQDAQTVEQTSVVDGTAFEAGQVALRDVGLRAPTGDSYAQGDTAFLEGLVVNRAAASDQLVSVSSPIATSVVFYANSVDALQGTAQSASGSASPSGSASSPTDAAPPSNTGTPSQGGSPSETGSQPTDTGSPSGSGTPSSSTSSSTSSVAPLAQIALPTNKPVQFGYQSDQPAIVFLGLTQPLFPSQSFQITFTFANGGSVTATVSVKLPVDSSNTAPSVDTEQSEGN